MENLNKSAIYFLLIVCGTSVLNAQNYRVAIKFPYQNIVGNEPSDIALSPIDKSIFISRMSEGKILKFDSLGRFIKIFADSANGGLKNPYGISFEKNGDLLVVDVHNQNVKKFNYSGKLLFTVGGVGSNNGQFFNPWDIATDKSGNFYVTDFSWSGGVNNRIQKFDSSGNFLLSWGSGGFGKGQFATANRIQIVESGFVYVADRDSNNLCRIQKFDLSGNYLFSWIFPGDINEFYVTNSQTFYFTYSNWIIKWYDTFGRLLKSMGPSCQFCAPANTIVLSPFGLKLDECSNIYVGSSDYNYPNISYVGAIFAPLPSVFNYQYNCVNRTTNFTFSNLCIGPRLNISWDFGDIYNLATNTASGYSVGHIYTKTSNYKVRMVVKYHGGNDTVFQTVNVQDYVLPQNPNLGKDTTVECYNSLVLNASSSSGHLWSNFSSNNNLIVTAPGVYWVDNINQCGRVSDTITVTWKTPDNPQVLFRPNMISVSDSCVIDNVKFSIKDTTGVKKIQWDFGDSNSSTMTNPMHQYSTKGDYLIKLIAWQLCYADSSTKEIKVDPIPLVNLGGDNSIRCNEVLELKNGLNETYSKYIWNNGSSNPNLFINTDGKYWLTVQNACGTASDTIEIRNRNVIIPNVFTPNSDGKNDELILGNYLPKTGKLTIMNRWGTEVFKSENYQNDWKAENILSDGLYFYRFESVCEKIEGYLQVLR